MFYSFLLLLLTKLLTRWRAILHHELIDRISRSLTETNCCETGRLRPRGVRNDSLKITFEPIWLPHCPACMWTISRMFLDDRGVRRWTIDWPNDHQLRTTTVSSHSPFDHSSVVTYRLVWLYTGLLCVRCDVINSVNEAGGTAGLCLSHTGFPTKTGVGLQATGCRLQ